MVVLLMCKFHLNNLLPAWLTKENSGSGPCDDVIGDAELASFVLNVGILAAIGMH